MNIQELLSNERNKKIICVLLLLVIALFSFFVFAKYASNPESYQTTIESIDEKKTEVMKISATAATASTVLAAIPGDVTTPIANQIMDISAYLLIVVCALVLEKSMLTVMGFVAFKILLPVACVLYGVYVFSKKNTLKVLATKFVVFSLVIVSIIPISIKISDLIYETNKATIEKITSEINEDLVGDEEQEDQSWLDKIIDKVQNGITNANEKAKGLLNKFIDAIALFIIAYCAIPIIIILLVIWFVKFLFGISIPIPRAKDLQFIKKRKTDEVEKLPEA